MTVIVGWTDGQRAIVGADRMASNGYDQPFAMTKVEQHKGWVFAITGECWLAPVARAASIWHHTDVETVMRGIRDALKGEGWDRLERKGQPWSAAVGGLLARGPDLWWFTRDLYPHRVEPGRIAAAGCGADYAAGAAYGRKLKGEALVRHCLEAACSLSMPCGLGFDIVQTPEMRVVVGS